MSFESALELLGMVATIIGLVGTAMWKMYAHLSARISANSADIHRKIDEVKANYVRRDDLPVYLNPIKEGMDRLSHQMAEIERLLRER